VEEQESVTTSPDREVDLEESITAHGELPDQCLLGGMFGSPEIGVVVGQLTEERDARLAQLKLEHGQQVEQLTEEAEDWETRRQNLDELSDATRQEITRQRNELAGLMQRAESSRNAKRTLVRTLARRRFAYPVRLLEHKVREQVELGRSLAKALAESERTLFELDRERHEFDRQRRELNKDEYQRRSQDLRRRRERIDEQLVELDRKLAALQQMGITAKTHGFLIWAGYLSFPAFGWLAGEAIRNALSDEQSMLNEIVGLLARSVVNVSESVGSLVAAGLVVSVPLLLLFLCVGLFLGMDRVLKRADQSWDRGGGSKKRSSALLSSTRTAVDRRDYLQMLARIPLLYLWLMIPVGLAALMAFAGEDEDIETLAGLWTRPGEALVYTLLGGTLAVVVAGFLMLYCSRVVEARLVTRQPSTWRDGLLVNFELVAIGAAAVLAVLVQGVLGLFGQTAAWAVNSAPGVLLLLLLGGLVVAYGMMYKGLFHTRRAVLQELQLLDEEIGRYEAAPAVYVDDEEAFEYRQHLRALYREIDDRWRQVELYDRPRLGIRAAMARAFDGDDEDGWKVPYRALDTLIEPELVHKIDDTALEFATIDAEVGVRQAELQRLEREVQHYQTESRDAHAQTVSCQGSLAELRRDSAREQFRIKRLYRELIVRCQTAYEMGRGLGSSEVPDPRFPDLRAVS